MGFFPGFGLGHAVRVSSERAVQDAQWDASPSASPLPGSGVHDECIPAHPFSSPRWPPLPQCPVPPPRQHLVFPPRFLPTSPFLRMDDEDRRQAAFAACFVEALFARRSERVDGGPRVKAEVCSEGPQPASATAMAQPVAATEATGSGARTTPPPPGLSTVDEKSKSPTPTSRSPSPTTPREAPPRVELLPNPDRRQEPRRSRSRSLAKPPGLFHAAGHPPHVPQHGQPPWTAGQWGVAQTPPSHGSTGWWYPHWTYPQVQPRQEGVPHPRPRPRDKVDLRPADRRGQRAPPSEPVHGAAGPVSNARVVVRPRRRRHVRSQKALDARAAKRAAHRERRARSSSTSSSSS